MILNCTAQERSTWLAFTEEERRALREHDHVALFEMGAHPFLTLTLFIAMFERDHGPLEYQRAYGAAMRHISLPYPAAHPRPAPDLHRPPRPVAAPGQSLVRVTAAPVVPLDLLCASGTSYFGRAVLTWTTGPERSGRDG